MDFLRPFWAFLELFKPNFVSFQKDANLGAEQRVKGVFRVWL